MAFGPAVTAMKLSELVVPCEKLAPGAVNVTTVPGAGTPDISIGTAYAVTDPQLMECTRRVGWLDAVEVMY
jgi:hypothetical protein